MDEKNLTHLNDAGEVHMVDVGDKPATRRTAVAEGVVAMPPDLVARFIAGDLPKGDAAALVRVAGIMGAKKTPELIPLCHPIAIDSVEIAVTPCGHGVLITATVSTTGQTGVEMEAMTAVATAALTVYDKVKGVERGVTIESVRLRKKEGGRTGTWERSEISSEIID